ncbi:MAG: hypothetical protein IJV45_02825 [Prevotella sp.]|nr:hypothetical protein [Prevotella sp.]
MMNQDEQQIRQLIERFLDGDTSNAEEQMLYDYFAGGDVAKSLRKYREMFRWYADGMPERARSRRLWPRLAVAASLVAVIACGAVYYENRKEAEQMARFEGSYIVRDGKKITDLRKIMPELKQALSEAEQRQLRIERLLNGEQQGDDDLPII